jgi:hypothetical protein
VWVLQSENVFCSEFVATIYQGMGLMSPVIDPADVLPVDYLPENFGVERNVGFRGPPGACSLMFAQRKEFVSPTCTLHFYFV